MTKTIGEKIQFHKENEKNIKEKLKEEVRQKFQY